MARIKDYGGKMTGRTIFIENGNMVVPFVIYTCVYCGKDVPENDPRKELNQGISCCDCAFKNSDMSEEEYLKTACFWFSGPGKYAFIQNGEIIVGSGKRYTGEKDKRNTIEYKLWRKSVFERDRYICQKCDKHGGTLNAHHVKAYKDNKDLRLEISNGITLCVKCHRVAHGSH